MRAADFLPDDPEEWEKLIEQARENEFERPAAFSPPEEEEKPTPCEGVGDSESSSVTQNSDSLTEKIADGKDTSVSGFPLIQAGDIREAQETVDFVEDLLLEGGASVIYGPSNTGKSFWALELGAAVADGRPFMGLETEQGAVVYVALEGETGAKNRLHALLKGGRLRTDSPFYLCFAQFSMLSDKDVMKVLSTISDATAKASIKTQLVIIDTLSRSIPGGNENDAKDMTKLISSVDRIRAESGAHVALIHHTGKNEQNGARGHSSLKGAVDTEIKITRSPESEVSRVTMTKQRDMAKNGPMAFKLKILHLGINRRGKPITSCIVEHEGDIPKEALPKKGRPPKCTPEDLLELLPAKQVSEWAASAKQEYGIGRTAFHELKKLLISEELAHECPETKMWKRLEL